MNQTSDAKATPKRLSEAAHRPLRDGETYQPYMPASAAPDEFTIKALFFGILFGILFGSANAYLGLRAGLTISTSIPVAVMAVAAFQVMKKFGGRVVEVNPKDRVQRAAAPSPEHEPDGDMLDPGEPPER